MTRHYNPKEIKKDIYQNDVLIHPHLGIMEDCYFNEKDSHYLEYCHDAAKFGYFGLSNQDYDTCLKRTYKRQQSNSKKQNASYYITS